MAWLAFLFWVVIVTAGAFGQLANGLRQTNDGAVATALCLATMVRILPAVAFGYFVYQSLVYFGF